MGNVLGPIDVILRFTLHVPLLDLRGTSLGLVNVVRVELLVSLPFFKGATIVLCLFVLREVLPQLSDDPGEVTTIVLGAFGNQVLVDDVFAEDEVAVQRSGDTILFTRRIIGGGELVGARRRGGWRWRWSVDELGCRRGGIWVWRRDDLEDILLRLASMDVGWEPSVSTESTRSNQVHVP